MDKEGENKATHSDEKKPEQTRETPHFDENNIEEMRRRLYARNNKSAGFERRGAPKREVHSDMVRKEPEHVAPTPLESSESHAHSTPATPATPATPQSEEKEESATLNDMPKKNLRRRFRVILLLVAGIFFLGALVVSSILLFREGGTISGENISIAAEGSSAVGGGEVYEFQIAIANQNAVPIKSASLVIEYPEGTLAPDGSDQSLIVARESLGVIESGETVNVSPKARIFGEENEQKEIRVKIEYRVEGSNATFERPAEPIRFRISTSPVVLSLETVDAISSGQEIELDLVVESNSSSPLEDLLVKVSYPDGFDFTESSVETVSGEDTWSIESLEPNQEETITIKGLLTGNENDVRRFEATIGVPRDGNLSQIASQLGFAQTQVLVEEALFNAGILINGSSREEVVVAQRDNVNVEVKYTNTLDTVIYDGFVSVALSGSAMEEYDIRASGGEYSSVSNTITWNSGSYEELEEILPGETVTLDFLLDPSVINVRTPEVTIDVTSRGGTFREGGANRNLAGQSSRTIKVESTPDVDSLTVYGEGPFVNTGPVPPVAEKVTQYTFIFVVEAGFNDLADAELTAKLPPGVTWLDLVTTDDSFSYNATSRVITWDIGSIDAEDEARASVQVSFKPSVSQIGRIPTILETQQFRAIDRFTGSTVRDTAPALTTNFTGDRNDKDGIARVVEE